MATPTKLDTAQLLRDARLRVTGPRRSVLRVVDAHPHADTETIIEATRAELGQISVQGVYNILTALSERGVLRRIQPAQSVARYELDRGDNHHHLACRGCGAIRNVACAVGMAPCLRPSTDHGYQIDEAEVLYWGHCPACRTTPEHHS